MTTRNETNAGHTWGAPIYIFTGKVQNVTTSVFNKTCIIVGIKS